MSQAPEFLTLTTTGWLNRQQEDAIDYPRLLVREYVEHTTTVKGGTRGWATGCYQSHHRRSRTPTFGGADASARVGGLLNYYRREAA